MIGPEPPEKKFKSSEDARSIQELEKKLVQLESRFTQCVQRWKSIQKEYIRVGYRIWRQEYVKNN